MTPVRPKTEAAEHEWLAREVVMTAHLTDAERVAILLDLAQTIELIRANKTTADLAREEAVRRELDRPGRERYRLLAERLAAR